MRILPFKRRPHPEEARSAVSKDEEAERPSRIRRAFHRTLHVTMADAILREKHIKKWRRAWKIMLIESSNPAWRDLYEKIGP